MCGHYFTLPKLMAISTGHTRQTLCCPKCRRNKSAYEAKMKPYSHKPKALWQRGKRQKVREESRYFGFELEVAPDKEAAGPIIPIQQNLYPLLGKIEKNFPYLYTKADASLPTGGVEIVSHPFTEKWFTENQSEVVRMLKILQDENYTGDSSQCGFHIHINRRCLTQPDTGLAALNYLLIKDKPAFETFSRRRTFTYCKCRGSYEEYCEVKDLLNKWLKQGDPTAASYFLLQRLSCERNSAINTHPRRTLEWRLFQSTIKRLDFFAAVQFIFNLTDWMNTVQLTPELDTCTLDTIINLRPQPELQKYYKQFIPKITEARKKYSVPLTDGDEKENDDGDY
jgi:hypothetical protein